MNYIKSEDYKKGANDLAVRIIEELKNNKRVLWLLTGGSSIPSSSEVLNLVKSKIANLSNLTVTLTDERYGEIGHADSSWQKLTDSGFDFGVVNSIPVLTGKSFEDTSMDWKESISKAFSNNDVIISQFGIGSDLHIAGILPESVAASEVDLVSYYHTDTFNRITLSLEGIKKINVAYVFIFGDSKKAVIEELKSNNLPLLLKPANILKAIPEVLIYSDQI